MRIGIDARLLGPKQGGIGRYVEQLILHLEKTPSFSPPYQGGDNHSLLLGKEGAGGGLDLEFVIFLRKANWNEFTCPPCQGGPQGKGLSRHSGTPPRGGGRPHPRFKKVLADIPWYGWREQIFLPRIFYKEKIDLMHFPHWNIPLFYRRPFVVTIHDLLLLHFPTRAASTLGPISYFFKQLAYKLVLKSSVRRAKRVITISEFSKKDIIQTLRVPPEKIAVTYLAPYQSPLPPTPYSLLPKYKISKPYILYVGNALPHKNLEGLLAAWKIFCEKYGSEYQLVLVGREDFFYKKLICHSEGFTRGISTGNCSGDPSRGARDDSTVFTGFVPDADLPALYQNASLYVFPSFYEGFGLPPLEAMAYGIPVVSSKATVLPEILGPAALYFDPNSHIQMAKTIKKGLTDEKLRAEMIKNSQLQLQKYSWVKTALATRDIYQNAVDNL